MRIVLKIIGIVVSVCVAVYIVQTDVVGTLLVHLRDFQLLGSFVAGFFFTSFFTAVPSIAVLGEIMRATPVWQVALIGGLGAALGDYVILRVIHKSLDEETKNLLRQPRFGGFKKIVKTKLFHRTSLFFGAVCISSPLPDELGLILIGINKVSPIKLFLILFVMHSIGIAAIGYSVRALFF